MVTDKAEEQTALHFACIILFLYLRIRACFLSRRSAASPSVPPVDAQQSLRPATVTEVTAKSLYFRFDSKAFKCVFTPQFAVLTR